MKEEIQNASSVPPENPSFKITKITVVRRASGMDHVVLATDLPTACPGPDYPTDMLVYTRKDYGETWARENFPNIPIEIVGA